SLIPAERIEHSILLIRGQKVILDRDLGDLYGVETKTLNRAVRRNLDRFPSDFMFQLTLKEFTALRCQFGTSKGRGGAALSSSGVYRAGRGHAFERSKQQTSRAGQHRDHAGICPSAAAPGHE